MQRNSLSAITVVLAAGLLWGTVGPAEILAHSPAGPVALGGARILSGGLVLAAIMLVRDPGAFRALPRAAWPALLAASTATAIFQGTFLTSAARTGAAVATAVTFGIAPVSTGLCERIVLGARLSRRWLAGTACAIAGCALISLAQGIGPSRADFPGIACGVVAGGCFGVYTVSAKRLIEANVTMLAAVPVTLLLGGAVLAPWTLPGLKELAGPRSLGLVAWLGPVTVALAYWLYVTGLRHLTAATVGTLSLAEPLVATALGIGILHERLSLPIAVGALLLLGGLILVSLSWPARTAYGLENGASETTVALFAADVKMRSIAPGGCGVTRGTGVPHMRRLVVVELSRSGANLVLIGDAFLDGTLKYTGKDTIPYDAKFLKGCARYDSDITYGSDIVPGIEATAKVALPVAKLAVLAKRKSMLVAVALGKNTQLARQNTCDSVWAKPNVCVIYKQSLTGKFQLIRVK